MTLSRIAAFVIGVDLAVIGLMVVFAAPTVFIPDLLAGLLLVIIGVWVFLGLHMSV